MPPVLVPRLAPGEIPERFQNFDMLSKKEFHEDDWVVAPTISLDSQRCAPCILFFELFQF